MSSLKKKYTQNDLRRLMSEQKAKSAPKTTTTKINSPLAKYPFSKRFQFWIQSNLNCIYILKIMNISLSLFQFFYFP